MAGKIAIIIHWELADWARRSKEAQHKIQKWFTYPLKAFGVNRLLVVDVDKTNPNWSDAEMDVTNYASLSDALKALPKYKPVYIERGILSSTLLSGYVHPSKDTMYILGSDYGLPLKPSKADCIEIDQVGEYTCLYSAQCISIVLYDRMAKE